MDESPKEPAPPNRTPYDVPVGLSEVEYSSHASTSRNLMLIGVYLLLLAAYGAWEAQEGQGLWPIALVIGIALLVAGGCYFAFQSLFRTRIRVYRNGVEVETIWSRSFTRWEDIEAIFEFDPPIERNSLGMEVHNYRCGFSQTDGDTFWFHINRMSGLRDFVARLHKRVDDRFRARARAALAAGEVAWFGPVGIGRDGIHSHKGDVLPWSEVSFAGCVHDTHFEVLKKGSNWGWFSRKISDVENVAILNELIKSRKEWMSPA